MDAAEELGRNPVSKHEIQPEYGDTQIGAGRYCRTRLARPNSQARTWTGKCLFSLFSWPRAGLATFTRFIHTLLLYVWPYIQYANLGSIDVEASSTAAKGMRLGRAKAAWAISAETSKMVPAIPVDKGPQVRRARIERPRPNWIEQANQLV